MENYFEIDEPIKKRGFTIGKLLKFIVGALIIFMLGTIVVRCSLYSDDKIVKKVLVNEVTRTAYQENPEDFAVEKYGIKKSWIDVSQGRIIEFKELYHIKEAKQLQFCVKYKMDIAEYVDDTTGIPFKFTLVDNYSISYTDYFFEQKEKHGYNYIRLCFENIELVDEKKAPNSAGLPARKTYTLLVDRLEEDGSYRELCRAEIYSGSGVSKPVKVNIK